MHGNLPAFPNYKFLHCFPNFGNNFWPILINIMFDDFMAIYVLVILYILIVVC